ncbi:MAG TPA: hypothetical protein VJ521_08695, partial [Acidobacteriota bacterium]|nr:hypothetical protein [Acidobacteriota bacterium]
MRKYIFFSMLFLISAVLLAAQQYTVVLKNGKIMTGTLISESADGIVFKDADGVQFSLKKSGLDLEKMQEANAIQPPTTSMQEEELKAPKKKGRVYTKEDLEELKTKYGELITAEQAIE